MRFKEFLARYMSAVVVKIEKLSVSVILITWRNEPSACCVCQLHLSMVQLAQFIIVYEQMQCSIYTQFYIKTMKTLTCFDSPKDDHQGIYISSASV